MLSGFVSQSAAGMSLVIDAVGLSRIHHAVKALFTTLCCCFGKLLDLAASLIIDLAAQALHQAGLGICGKPVFGRP